jgi:hypothetical protein
MIDKVEIISLKWNKKSKAPDVPENQTFGFSFLWAIFYSEKRGYIGATI